MRWHAAALALLLLLSLAGCTVGGAASVRPPADASRAGAAQQSSPAPSPTPTPSPLSTPTTTGPPPTVVLDPGHNGGNAAHPEVVNAPVPDGSGGTKPCNTTGTATDAGFPEHAFTWDVALRVRDRLTAAGVTVVLTRQDDAGVGPCIDVRGRLAGEVGAAAFVSIHGDGASAGGRGFHVITSSLDPAGPQVAAGSAALATAIRDTLRSGEPVSDYAGSDGLVSRPDLAGLNLNAVPAVYVECGNMRNAADAALMTSPEGRDAIADRLAEAVLAFLGR